MQRLTTFIVVAVAALAAASAALASPYVRYGVQDDAWLRYGSGTLDERAATLKSLGTDVVRYTLVWRELEPRRGVYDWRSADAVLDALHAHGIEPVVTLWGTPAWANRGRPANWAPTSTWTFAAFAKAAANRYPYVRRWLVWNEPNKAPFLRPTSARTYVQQLLNPAYAAIHAANRRALVGGGVTGPIAGAGGVSP
ncbi:MAG TPA: beta-galactosidase, partial [Gaiellaceae bacterium]|nr:beta-galactosidase [Gaiellaceae bacterium]